MADVAQGPGWWNASDGKWYPPELHPSRMPPLQWGAAPQFVESTPRTNGLAIASLVLSLTIFLLGPDLGGHLWCHRSAPNSRVKRRPKR